jgi:tight adherence protein C
MINMNPSTLFSIALGLVAFAMVLLGAGLWRRQARQGRHLKAVDRALSGRESRMAQAVDTTSDGPTRVEKAMRLADSVGGSLGTSRYADSFIAQEDRHLIELCGFQDVNQARARFVFARVVLMLCLPLVFIPLLDGHLFKNNPSFFYATVIFFGVAFGYLAPKWVLRRKARARRVAAKKELPLFIDLLRLLQGVGLSIDQSLQVLVSDFSVVMPVLAFELRIATDLHARGRSREQSLHRLANSFDNDDLAAISRLIVQVDRHGGAVQEPLARFGERIREQHRLDLKETVGKLTVKMTGVMVVTLLPALLIVTAGAGFLAVFRGLSHVTGVH